MQKVAKVAELYVYPIKSCRGIPQSPARTEAEGFAGDRMLMLIDNQDRFITQRKYGQLALIQVELIAGGFRLSAPGMPALLVTDDAIDPAIQTAKIWQDEVEVCVYDKNINAWFTEFLGIDCRLVKKQARLRQVDPAYAAPGEGVSLADGFPYLLTNTASLDDVSARLGEPMTMQRFRPNIVIEHDQAFIEDSWNNIQIGEARFRVAKPCSRCVLTTVDPETGLRHPDGQPLKLLKSYRQGEHGVYFGQNLLLTKAGEIKLDDAVYLID